MSSASNEDQRLEEFHLFTSSVDEEDVDNVNDDDSVVDEGRNDEEIEKDTNTSSCSNNNTSNTTQEQNEIIENDIHPLTSSLLHVEPSLNNNNEQIDDSRYMNLNNDYSSDQLSYQNEDEVINIYSYDDEDDDDDDDDHSSTIDQKPKAEKVAIRWNTFLHKNHMYILLTVLLLLIPLGIYSFPKFITSTDSTIHPIPYSASAQAINRFRDAFGGGNKDGSNDGKGGIGLVMNDPLNPGIVVLLEHHNKTSSSSSADATMIDGKSDLSKTTKNYTMELHNYLNENLPIPSTCDDNSKNQNSPSKKAFIDEQFYKRHELTNDHIIEPDVQITSYYSLHDEKLDTLAKELVAKEGHVLLLYIQYTIPSCLYSSSTSITSQIVSFWQTPLQPSNNEHIQHNIQRSYSSSILSSIQRFSNEHLLLQKQKSSHHHSSSSSLYNVTLGYTGIVSFQEDMSTSVKKDIRRMHTFILPLSLILLCVALQGHISLMIIPIFSVLCVCCGWSIIMILIIHFGLMQITQFTPNVMMSLTIGLGIDYTLFLLSRVLTEITILRRQTMHWRKKRRERLESDDYYNHSSFNDWNNQNTNLSEGEGINGSSGLNSLQNEEEEEQRQRKINEEDEAEEMDIQYEAISIMIQHAGQTVLMSGITLMFTFLGLLLFPIHAMKSVSVGASVCIIFCLFVNLTIVPSLLHSPLGKYLLQWSRPRSGGTGMQSMILSIKSCIVTYRHKYKVWKYKSNRSLLSSSSSSHQQLVDGFASHHNLNASEHDGNNNIGGAETNLDEGNRSPDDDFYSDDKYTSFQDLIFQQELSKDDSIKTVKQSNISDMFNDYTMNNGGLHERLLSRNITLNDDEMRANSSDVDKSSFWYSFSNHLLHETKSTIIALSIIALLFPVALQARNVTTTLSFESTLPSRSMSMKTFNRLGSLFGKGHLSPYQLMFDGLNFDERIDTSDAFEVMQETIEQIEQVSIEGRTLQTNCTGIAWSNGKMVSFATYDLAKKCTSITFADCPIESFRELMKVDSISTTKDGLSTLVTCNLSEDSYSDDAIAWLGQTREKLRLLKVNGGLKNYTVSILNGASVNYDAREAVSDSMGMMIATTFLCVFVVIALFFESIVTPVRSVLTIAITLFTVYGLVALVYQNGGDHSMISWLTVPMSFSIIVGLALDYDIFLINRILEFRIAGYDHKSSIVAGLCSTGNIITAAGVIMSVSFGGLMFSDSPVVYQWSFALTMAVLLDTFIMRSCLVPILLYKTGIFSWFPRSLPHSTISLETQLFHENDNHLLL